MATPCLLVGRQDASAVPISHRPGCLPRTLRKTTIHSALYPRNGHERRTRPMTLMQVTLLMHLKLFILSLLIAFQGFLKHTLETWLRLELMCISFLFWMQATKKRSSCIFLNSRCTTFIPGKESHVSGISAVTITCYSNP